MEFKVRMVVEATFKVNPDNYKSHKELPDLPAAEMLAIDIDAIKADPGQWVEHICDEVDEEHEGFKFEVTGEVLE